MLCENCGTRVSESNTNCPVCGLKIERDSKNNKGVTKSLNIENPPNNKKKIITVCSLVIVCLISIFVCLIVYSMPKKYELNSYTSSDVSTEITKRSQHPHYKDIPAYIEVADSYGSGRAHIVVVDDFLPLRKGPGTSYDVVHSVSNNTVITVIGTKNGSDWLLASCDGVYGWVNGDYLELADA